ncbi:hypothetical protein IMG5_151420, partial [Ichthyophthirius multifiliis]
DNLTSMKINIIYIKGSTLKYFQLDEACVDKAIEEAEIQKSDKQRGGFDKPRGGFKDKFDKGRGGFKGKTKSRGS